MKIVGGYLDTRRNGEDIALTPYLFGVFANLEKSKVKIYGIGICWIYFSFYIGIGFGLPKKYSGFRIIKKDAPTT